MMARFARCAENILLKKTTTLKFARFADGRMTASKGMIRITMAGQIT